MAKRPRPSTRAARSKTPARKKATKAATPRAVKKASAAPRASAATPARAAKVAKAPAKRPARARAAAAEPVVEGIELDASPRVTPAASEASTGTSRVASQQATPPAPPAPEKRSTRFAIELARCCADDKCEDVVLLDVSAIRQDMDYVLIASGTSDRQMRSVLRHLEELGDASGQACLRTSSDERATWLLADFVDIVVHLFEPHTRSHYDLEMMWGDAPRVAWQRADQVVRDRAQLRASQAGGA